MIVDTHVHLDDRRYAQDLDAVLRRAVGQDVTACIVIGTDLPSSQAAIALAERYAAGPCRLYAAVGVHPTSADALTPASLKQLAELAQHPRVVAIGEIGLDYYWPRQRDRNWACAEPPQQRRAFFKQLALAADLGLPAVIHDRDAHEDTLRTLRDWVAEGAQRTGTLHAYAGGLEWLEEALALGLYIGMDGPVTFGNASNLHAVAREVPLERLLLETDGPYLTPVPHRGKRNEPAYLTFVAQKIAELRGVTPKAIARATTENAIRLFKIKAER